MNLRVSNWQRSSVVYTAFAIMISLVLSAGIAYHESLLNPDSICYLQSAQLLGKSGLSAAMHLCGQARWPFYSVLIYAGVQLGHLSYANTAYLLDAIFSALSVLTFILIVKELGGSKRVCWFAAGVILLSHEFNSVREYIVRDHGYWAFYLLSIFFLLRYFQRPNWPRAFAWSTSLLLATLFRIEGSVFLLVLPFTSFFCLRMPLKQRLHSFLQLNVMTIFFAVSISGWLLLHPQQTLDQLGRLVELKKQLIYGIEYIGIRYQSAKTALAQHVLTTDSRRDAGFLWPLMFVGWYAVSVVMNLSLIYAALVIYAWRQRIRFASSAATIVFLGYVLINVFITFGFLAEHFFLSKRYLLALSLVLMLRVPFALEHLMKRSSGVPAEKRGNSFHDFMLRKSKAFACTKGENRDSPPLQPPSRKVSAGTAERSSYWLFSVVVFFIFISSLGGIFDFGVSKVYIRSAGDWLATHVPKSASLYANDYQLMYYSAHFGDDIFAKHPIFANTATIAQGKWKQYDYLALRFSKQQSAEMASVLQEIKLTPIQDFHNNHGDHVVIYRVR